MLNALLLKERVDARHKGTQVTVTAGLGCPRKWAIHHMLQTPVDPAKMWAAQKGTWLHEQMGHALTGVEGWLTEESHPDECVFHGRLFGVELSCKVDARMMDYSAVWDYKFRGDYASRYIDPTGEAKAEDAAQMNMIRLLMEQQTGLDLSGMEMRVWVDSKGWIPTFAPLMDETAIGLVKPGSGTHTIAEIFEWLKSTSQVWTQLAQAEGCEPEKVSQEALEVLVRTIPRVGLEMFRNKQGGNMCTNYCEVAQRCMGLDGGV